MTNNVMFFGFEFGKDNIELNRIVECTINEKEIVKISVQEDDGNVLEFAYLIISDFLGKENIIDSRKQVVKNISFKNKMFAIFIPKPLACHLKNAEFKQFDFTGKTLTLKIEYAACENKAALN
jgi:hypothetical protein